MSDTRSRDDVRGELSSFLTLITSQSSDLVHKHKTFMSDDKMSETMYRKAVDFKQEGDVNKLTKENIHDTQIMLTKLMKDIDNNQQKSGKYQTVTKSQQKSETKTCYNDNKASYDNKAAYENRVFDVNKASDRVKAHDSNKTSERSKPLDKNKTDDVDVDVEDTSDGKQKMYELLGVDRLRFSDSTARKQELDPHSDVSLGKFQGLVSDPGMDGSCHSEKMDQPKSLETGSSAVSMDVAEQSINIKDQSAHRHKTEIRGAHSQVSVDDNNWCGDAPGDTISIRVSGTGREPCESEDISEAPECPESLEEKHWLDHPKFVEMPGYIERPYIVLFDPSGSVVLLWDKMKNKCRLIQFKNMTVNEDMHELKCRIDEHIREHYVDIKSKLPKTVLELETDWEKEEEDSSEKTDTVPEKNENATEQSNALTQVHLSDSEPVGNDSTVDAKIHEEIVSNEVVEMSQESFNFLPMSYHNIVELPEIEDDSENSGMIEDFLEKDSVECLEKFVKEDMQITECPVKACTNVNAANSDEDAVNEEMAEESIIKIKSDVESEIVDEINGPTNDCRFYNNADPMPIVLDVEDGQKFHFLSDIIGKRRQTKDVKVNCTDSTITEMKVFKREKNRPSALVLMENKNMCKVATKASTMPGRYKIYPYKYPKMISKSLDKHNKFEKYHFGKNVKFGRAGFNFGQESLKRKRKLSMNPVATRYYRLPERLRGSRGLMMFRDQPAGRRCSGANNSGGRGMQEQQAGNKDSDSHSGGGKGGDKSQENTNKNNTNNNRDKLGNNNFKNGNPGDYGEDKQPTQTGALFGLTQPPRNFKHYRKKEHGNISPDDLQVYLGKIWQKCRDQGPVCDIDNPEVALCVKKILQMLEDLSEDLPNCTTCIVLHSLLKHFVSCEDNSTCVEATEKCSQCIQIFSLICSHVSGCLKTTNGLSLADETTDVETMCVIKLCTRITQKLDRKDLASQVHIMWFYVRRILGRIIDGVALDNEEFIDRNLKTEAPAPHLQKRPSRLSRTGMSPTLASIPETQPLSTTASPSNSRTLRRNRSSLASVEENAQGTNEPQAEDTPYVRAEIEDESEDESDALPTASDQPVDDEQEPHNELRGGVLGNLESEPISGGSGSSSGDFKMGRGHASLPMGPPGYNPPYFISIKDKPTGIKGIDEVVYGTKSQLAKVVQIFEEFKQRYIIETKLSKHYREEGVILKEFKNKLQIVGIRYNIHFQWVKLTHLGNGMTGKCFLAKDFNTDFLFCVKEIHISNYEKEEIVLWSELEHPYIVQIYGAIRHGEKIFILQEFIDGGCLTEAINAQRKLGQRLSQRTALQLFRQLLEVLVYLRSRDILHEDIKADNILLWKSNGSVSIKMTDFGLARRLQGNRKYNRLVGTQTQWSPEKAQQIEYGFPAEVWAAGCVLVHILSGFPPWIKRFSSLKALIIVIVEKSPPLEDIPRNIDPSIKEIIRETFTLSPAYRPTAEELLKQKAFNLLEDGNPEAVSMLDSFHIRMVHDNSIADCGEPVLREILESLEKKKSEKVHPPSKQEEEKADKPAAANYNTQVIYARPLLSTENHVNPEPSLPDLNTNPISHIERFYQDDLPKISLFGKSLVDSVATLQLYQSPSDSETSQNSDSSLPKNSDEIITKVLLPNFGKIGVQSFDFHNAIEETELPQLSVGSVDSEHMQSEELTESVNDADLKMIQESYIPNVVRMSESQYSRESDVSTFVEFSSSSSSSEYPDDTAITEESTREPTTTNMESGSNIDVVVNSRLSVNDDELFGSGNFKPGIIPNVVSESYNSTITGQYETTAFTPTKLTNDQPLQTGVVPNSVSVTLENISRPTQAQTQSLLSQAPVAGKLNEFLPNHQIPAMLVNQADSQGIPNHQTSLAGPNQIKSATKPAHPNSLAVSVQPNSMVLPNQHAFQHQQNVMANPSQPQSSRPLNPNWMLNQPNMRYMYQPQPELAQQLPPRTPTSYQNERQSWLRSPNRDTDHGMSVQNLQLRDRIMFVDSPSKGQTYIDYRSAQLNIFFNEKKTRGEQFLNEELKRLDDAIRKIYYAWSTGTPLAQSMPTEAYQYSQSKFTPSESPQIQSPSPQRAQSDLHGGYSPLDHRRLSEQYSPVNPGGMPPYGQRSAQMSPYQPDYSSTLVRARNRNPPTIQQSFQRWYSSHAATGMPHQYSPTAHSNNPNIRDHQVHPYIHGYPENTIYHAYAGNTNMHGNSTNVQGYYANFHEHQHGNTSFHGYSGQAMVHRYPGDPSFYGYPGYSNVEGHQGQLHVQGFSTSRSVHHSSNSVPHQATYQYAMSGIPLQADPGRTVTGLRPTVARDSFIMSPSINPRPPQPQGTIKNPGLQVDIKKAVQASEGLIQPSIYQSQTAPVLSPAKELQRGISTHSQPVLYHAADSHVSDVSQGELSTGGSRSQFEEQAILLEALQKEMSESSDPLEQYQQDIENGDDLAHAEFCLNSGDPQTDESLAHYLNDSHNDEAVTVKFICGEVEQSYKFPKSLKNKPWHELIKDELNWIPKKFSMEQYCLWTKDGNVLDIDLQPENSPLELLVAPKTPDGPWWADDLGLYFNHSPKPKSK